MEKQMKPPLKIMDDDKRIYQLKITLVDIHPPIWRRVLMPADVKLPKLHRYFQTIMGWENYHLHSFSVGDAIYSEPDPDYDDSRNINERRVRLLDIAGMGQPAFIYTYDYGDNWRHEVTVEKVLTADPDDNYPLCIGGKRACPPEDCGATSGYDHFLQALADPHHEDHEQLRGWIGGIFDSEGFDLNSINRALRKIR
jgi:hypothetical protein